MTTLTLRDLGFVAAGQGVAYDTDAQAYITAVETADGQALETAVKDAINAFVVGCKTDAIWTAIKACCILAGARTLAGALLPLVGAAPTNFNFVSADYNRKTGLVGNGSSKYLDSSRANNADPQNSSHVSVYASSVQTSAAYPVYLGAYNASAGMRQLRGGASSGQLSVRMQSVTLRSFSSLNQIGFIGATRSNSTNYAVRGNSTNQSFADGSATPTSSRICLFAQYQSVNSTPVEYTSARLAFYSIGEALDLALLDARVTTLINALAAAIP